MTRLLLVTGIAGMAGQRPDRPGAACARPVSDLAGAGDCLIHPLRLRPARLGADGKNTGTEGTTA